MQRRTIGQTGVDVSILGFGCMRLPVIDHKPNQIDYPKAPELLHYAIEHGVNYVDTAWMYHEDTCETWLGEALKGGYRERVTDTHLAHVRALPQVLPQLFADVDRTRAKQMGVSLTDIYDTMQVNLGSLYVNDFNRFGRTFQVIVQADSSFRDEPSDVARLQVRNEQGQPQSIFAINTDITEKKKLEDQFLRAQRLESIGVLASGIAHDLNNVLAPIIMGAPLLRDKVKDEASNDLLETIESSARRGAAVVTEFHPFPRLKALHFWLCGGDLGEQIALQVGGAIVGGLLGSLLSGGGKSSSDWSDDT